MPSRPSEVATEKTAINTAQNLSFIAKVAGSTLVAIAATVAAYAYLGLPIVATRGYVEDVIKPIVEKVEGVNQSGLNGRIEQLSGNRQRALAEKFDLELKARAVKDPAALQVLAGRQRDIDQIVKDLDEQIATTKAELLKSQENRKR